MNSVTVFGVHWPDPPTGPASADQVPSAFAAGVGTSDPLPCVLWRREGRCCWADVSLARWGAPRQSPRERFCTHAGESSKCAFVTIFPRCFAEASCPPASSRTHARRLPGACVRRGAGGGTAGLSTSLPSGSRAAFFVTLFPHILLSNTVTRFCRLNKL